MPDRASGNTPAPEPRWSRRLAWLAVIWVASVATVALVAYGLRFVMGWAGLTR